MTTHYPSLGIQWIIIIMVYSRLHFMKFMVNSSYISISLSLYIYLFIFNIYIYIISINISSIPIPLVQNWNCDRPRYARASCQTSRPWAQPLTPTWRLGCAWLRRGVDPTISTPGGCGHEILMLWSCYVVFVLCWLMLVICWILCFVFVPPYFRCRGLRPMLSSVADCFW